MNEYMDNLQLGFLIGIYFLALAIVTLTLVYFSRPRHKKPALKNSKEHLTQTNTAEGKSQQPLPNNHSPQQSEVVDNLIVPLTIVKGSNLPEPTPVVGNLPEPVIIAKESDMKRFGSSKKDTLEKPDSMAKSSPQPPDSPVHPPLITVTNATKAQAESVPTVGTIQEKPAQEQMKGEIKEELLKTDTIPVDSSIQAANENPKPASASNDFSDLFTEDTEETEATRLAKELKDIDTDDLLQTSQDLISQFKRKR